MQYASSRPAWHRLVNVPPGSAGRSGRHPTRAQAAVVPPSLSVFVWAIGPVANRAMSPLPGHRLRAAAGGHRGEGPAVAGAAAAEGFVPRIEFETYSPASIRELVAAGLGVAPLARSATERPGPAIGVCELARPPEHPPIGLIRCRARPLPPAARAFWDHLAATADGAEGGARERPLAGRESRIRARQAVAKRPGRQRIRVAS
jgi:DNA-binding transcriptional LysR family regulator